MIQSVLMAPILRNLEITTFSETIPKAVVKSDTMNNYFTV